MIINTGTPRSVKGHAVSGAIFAFMLSSSYEYMIYKRGQKDAKNSAKKIIRASLEGAIVAASGIAASNALGDRTKSPLRNSLEALSYVSMGIAGIYVVNKFTQNEPKSIAKKRKINETQALS